MARPYAGWAAIALFAIALFVGLVAASVTVPLFLLLAAGALAAFRYWDELKHFDLWAAEEMIRTRRDALSVRHWHAPHRAAEYFGSPDLVRARKEAAEEMNSLMMELIRRPDTASVSFPTSLGATRPEIARNHAQYDSAQARYNKASALLSREILEQLTRGDLLAKGLMMKDEVALSERIIPVSRWRVLNLDITKASAAGAGWNYVGIVVGKKANLNKAAAPAAGNPRPPEKLSS